MARPLIGQQLVALAAAALKAAHGVAAEVVAAGVVDQALVDVCGSQAGRGGEDGLGPQGGDHGPAPALPRLACLSLPRAELRSPNRARGCGPGSQRWGQEDELCHSPPGTQRARCPRHRRAGDDVCCDRQDSGDDGVHHVLSAAHPGQRPGGWRGLGRAGCFPVAAPLSQLLDPEPGPRSGGQAPEAHLRVPSEILSLRCLFSLQISSLAPTSRAPCRTPRFRT